MIHYLFWKCDNTALEQFVSILSSSFPNVQFSLSSLEEFQQIQHPELPENSTIVDSVISLIRTTTFAFSFISVVPEEKLSIFHQALIIHAFEKTGATVSTAESCTAGMIASSLADIPGSSSVLMGGIVSYDNDIKIRLLKVPSATLASVGAVSSEVAQQMALGARESLRTTYAVATTGIAGPGGGSIEKPVGTVWFGIASPQGSDTVCKHFDPSLSRSEIRRKTTCFALSLLFRELLQCQGEYPCDFFLNLL